jgi:hypothetical protein
MQAFLGCDDLVAFLLCFVGDTHKLTVMSHVNKTFGRMVNDPASWKGSDGFILQRPTMARLRLLQAVRMSNYSTHVFADWLPFCPSVTVLAGCDLSLRLRELTPFYDVVDNGINSLLTRAAMVRTPHLHTLILRYNDDDDDDDVDVSAFPALTDLTINYTFDEREVPLCAPTLLRLHVNTELAWDQTMHPPYDQVPWRLRELCIDGGSVDVDCMLALCARCPYLTSLDTHHNWKGAALGQLVAATPLLKHLRCEEMRDGEISALAGQWQHLESVDAQFIKEASLSTLLCEVRSIRRLITRNQSRGIVRAIRFAAPRLTHLTLYKGHFVVEEQCDAVHDMLAVVGATLSSLRGVRVNLVDIGLYCPRLRSLTCICRGPVDMTSVQHVIRGCPVLAEWTLSAHLTNAIDVTQWVDTLSAIRAATCHLDKFIVNSYS